MKNKEIKFVRPDALKEEVAPIVKEDVKVIGTVETKEKPKVDVVKVVNLEKKEKFSICPSYYTQYYG